MKWDGASEFTHKFTHTFCKYKINSDIFRYINKTGNFLIMSDNLFFRICGDLYGEFCSLRRLNRFKAPRKKLGALLFSLLPELETC